MLSQLDEQRISLYDKRGDLLEIKAISEMYGRKFYMQERLDELNQLIYDIEHPVEQAQAISDAEKVTDELANDEKWLDSDLDTNPKSFIELTQAHQARAKATVWVKPENCQHEKAYAIHSGMYCSECREIFPPRNDFEKRLVGSKNPRTNGYVNWKMR